MIEEKPSAHSLLRRIDSSMVRTPIREEHIELELNSRVEGRVRDYRIGNTTPLEPKQGDKKMQREYYQRLSRIPQRKRVS
jgi:hypothetical protein